jgi:hypothetical protein
VKPKPEYIEGPEAFARFQGIMQKVIAVPHAEVQRQVEQRRKEVAQNPNRRGPKRRS